MIARRRRWVALLLALAVAAGGLVVLWCSGLDGTPEPGARDFVVHPSPRGPRPLFIAWEHARCTDPTFVLYDDGTWIRDALDEGRCGRTSFTGRLAPDAAHALHQSVLAANLRAMPHGVRPLDAADGNEVAVAVREGDDTWVAALVSGIPARRPRALHERAVHEPVPESSSPFALSAQYREPIPEPFLVINELLVDFSETGVPFERSGWVLRIAVEGAPDELPAFLGPLRSWPASFPRRWRDAARAGDRERFVEIDEHEAASARLELARGELFVVDGRVVSVAGPHPAIPAHDEIAAVSYGALRASGALDPPRSP